MSDHDGPLLTIVTVLKDDPAGLEATLDSIASQNLSAASLVVIDSSTDRAEPRVNPLSSLLPVHYTWTSPSGVYPAMNLGLERATGQYVHFLNAGDRYHDEEVLSAIVPILRDRRPVWLYGQVCFVSPDGARHTPPPFDYRREQRRHFSGGRFAPHQGTFAARDTLIEVGGFDTRYRIAADYAAMLQLSERADPVILDTVIADFETGGLSSTDWRASVDEFHHARRSTFDLSGRAALAESWRTRKQVLRMRLARAMGRT